MKVAIINDCSYVMKDMLSELNKNFEIIFIKRSRKLVDKTFGISLKILRIKARLFHVNYALQDAFIVDKLKSLDVLHCHGSDVRWIAKSKKWGWLVRRNLQKAKLTLYSTPDMRNELERYAEYPIYLPNPIRTDLFKPVERNHVTPKAIYFEKWYEQLSPLIPLLCQKNGVRLTVIPLGTKIEHLKMPQFLNKFDIYIDRFEINSQSKTCLEAKSCGLSEVPIRGESLEETFGRYSDISYLKKRVQTNRNYVIENHNPAKVADRLTEIWKILL